MEISVWMKTFVMIRFEITIIFCEIKKNEVIFYCNWMIVVELTMNMLEWEWVFSKINILRNNNSQNSPNECKQKKP